MWTWAWEDLPVHVRTAIVLLVFLIFVYAIFWNHFDTTLAKDFFAKCLLLVALGAIAVIATYEVAMLWHRKRRIDRAMRRSHIVLGVGSVGVGIAALSAYTLGVPGGDIFAGTMGGLCAVVAAMAAFESADAAASANKIAERANTEQLVALLGIDPRPVSDVARIIIVNDGPQRVYIEKVEIGATEGGVYFSMNVSAKFGERLPISLDGFDKIEKCIPLEDVKNIFLKVTPGVLTWHTRITTATTRSFESNKFTPTPRD